MTSEKIVSSKDWIVLVCAGNSTRFGKDKMLVEWQGKPLLWHTATLAKKVCNNVAVVASKDNLLQFSQILGADFLMVQGGDTRSLSVLNGLQALPSDTRLVAIHDGARPFASADLFLRAFETALQKGSAVPVLPVTDTLYSTATTTPRPIDRATTQKAQTPQVFDFAKLLSAYTENTCSTDDGQIWLKKYGNLCLTEGEVTNVKVTYPNDLIAYAKHRTGVGFDAHRLVTGRKLILCGVEINFDKGLYGHSDADVAFHALCDAILSAIGEKDIGNLFPDTDPKYLGVDSGVLLDEVWQKDTAKGFLLGNASLTIMAQSPKLSPHVLKMRQNIAKHLNTDLQNVNVSATTTENLGITAEGKGMACYANVLLVSFDSMA